MTVTPLILLFPGGLLMIFLIARLLGHIIGLDKYLKADEHAKLVTTFLPGEEKESKKL